MGTSGEGRRSVGKARVTEQLLRKIESPPGAMNSPTPMGDKGAPDAKEGSGWQGRGSGEMGRDFRGSDKGFLKFFGFCGECVLV